jgi:glyoxylase-like metal-dependent hydrolase (beta-lactamase superfamily II)
MPLESPHFTLEQVEEHAWAAVATPSGGAVGNAGFADLGGRALVVDAFFTPSAAIDLRSAAEQLVGPIDRVVITHGDFDHYGGLPAFENVPVVAAQTTRETIAAAGPGRIESLRAEGGSYLADLERKGAPAWEVEQARVVLADLPRLQVIVPTEGFTAELELGGGRVLECGAGHTNSDSVVWLPEERVLFAGDLVVVDAHPNLTRGDPSNWLRTLDRLMELHPAAVVPGHGPPGGEESLATVRRYVETLLRLAAEPEDPVLPAEWAGWQFREGFEANVFALREHVAA